MLRQPSVSLDHSHFSMFGVWTRLAVQVVLKLFAELLNKSDGRHSRCVAERAKGATQHVFRQVLNVVDIFCFAKSGVKARQRFLEPVSAFAARYAPAATLMLIKADSTQCEFHHAGLVVDHDNAAGPEHRSRLAHLVEIHTEG